MMSICICPPVRGTPESDHQRVRRKIRFGTVPALVECRGSDWTSERSYTGQASAPHSRVSKSPRSPGATVAPGWIGASGASRRNSRAKRSSTRLSYSRGALAGKMGSPVPSSRVRWRALTCRPCTPTIEVTRDNNVSDRPRQCLKIDTWHQPVPLGGVHMAARAPLPRPGCVSYPHRCREDTRIDSRRAAR